MNDMPASGPAPGSAMRAQPPSMLSPSVGNLTRTRPSESGSLTFVTSPITSPAFQSRVAFGRITSLSVRGLRPLIAKRVRKSLWP